MSVHIMESGNGGMNIAGEAILVSSVVTDTTNTF